MNQDVAEAGYAAPVDLGKPCAQIRRDVLRQLSDDVKFLTMATMVIWFVELLERQGRRRIAEYCGKVEGVVEIDGPVTLPEPPRSESARAIAA